MADWHDVILEAEFPMSDRFTLVIKNHPIAVFKLEDNYYAIEDCCTHQAFPLSDGAVENGEITCPYHGAKFNIKTGEVTAPPAFVDVPTYEIRIHNGMIQVMI